MNGWLRDFFGKNAWGIMLAIISLVGLIFVMRRDVEGVIETARAIPGIQLKLASQEEINKGWDKYMLENNKRMERIENKLDNALSRK